MIEPVKVHQQLSVGKRNALPGKLLAQRLGVKDTREIRLIINELIAKGLPVIGGQSGYYIADSAQDCQENIDTLESYIKMTAIHRRNLKRAVERHFVGQGRLSL